MVYNPATDFLGLWRATGPNVSKMEMPGLDYVIAALARAGIINVSVSATQPVANQSTTAWLRPAVTSWTAEGAFFLWDKITTAYLAATPALFFQFLEASAGESSVSWWTTTGGPPANTVGSNGDYAIRTDGVGGIYGPKAAGAWPANPLPGTTNELNQAALDTTFGTTPGSLIIRDPTDWVPLLPGAANELLTIAGGLPAWATLDVLLDGVFSNARGSILYRDATGWAALGPGVANQVLATGGPGADPAWAPRAAEFPTGTRMVFNQTAAPPGWTKDVSINDYGLRVVAGAVGITPGTAFSTVFAQVATGGHALTEPELAPHGHPLGGGGSLGGTGSNGAQGGGTFLGATSPSAIVVGNAGGGVAHTHPINLALSYVDVILAVKD